MDRDDVMRKALTASVVFNLLGALAFAFPGSIGQLAGLPAPVPTVYAAALASLVALFGLTYAWLARRPQIDRSLVGFFAIGKASFFAVVLLCWLFGAASGLLLLTSSGDLAFAGIFAWWLMGAAEPAVATTVAR